MHRIISRVMLLCLASLASPLFAAMSAGVRAPPTQDVASLAISPDGSTLAVVSRFEGRNHLWLQPVAGGEARALPGTGDAVFPFWSPDGSKLAFFSEDELRQIDIQSKEVKTLVTGLGFPAGGSWGKNGTILLSTHGRYMIWSVPETGGALTPVVMLDGPDQFALVHPHFLPDGINFLYYTQGRENERGVYQGVVGAPFSRRLVDSEAAAVYAQGKLYYVQDGVLRARDFDEVLGILGNDEVIAEHVPMGGRSVAPLASNGKTVVYRTGPAGAYRQLTWFDRSGKRLGTVAEPYLGANSAPSLSPDGKSVVINYMREGMGEIGIVELASGTLSVVSDSPANDLAPLWASDGASVLYSSKRTGTIETYRQAVGQPTNAEKVFSMVALRHPMDMTRDGRYLFYRMNTPDVWALDQRSKQEIQIIPPGSPRTQWPQVSPDGRWIAFQSDLSGSTQVHLRGPFAPPSTGTTSKPLSPNGGGWVRWRGDGKELFYTEADGTLMSVSLTFEGDGDSFTAAAPKPLFKMPMFAGPENNAIAQQYLVSADGQRFLVIAAPEGESTVHVRTGR